MKTDCSTQKPRKKRSISLPVINGTGGSNDTIAHSKNSRWRAAALITLNLLMIAHIIQWKMMGSTVSPIEPSESMYTLQSGAVNAGFIFFIVAILATLIFGRFVCGWGCHIVALQDLCAWMLKKLGLKPVAFRSRLLIYIPLITALYMFVWPTVARYLTKPEGEPLFPQFTNHLITTDFWATFPPVFVAIPFLFIIGFVAVYFLGSKGFCTYGCPYGGFFAVADKFAPGKIRVTDACNQCGHCTATCTSNVNVHQEVNTYGMVVDPGCMKCMDCISVCPNDALYFGFGKPSVAVKKTTKATYSLTWPEEIAGSIIFIISYFAVWNVYQLVPMLMAIGIAIITTFLTLKAWRLLGSEDTAFYGSSLRSAGRFRFNGIAFLLFSFLWIGLSIHSGYVRYNESAGLRAYDQLQIPDELALAESDPRQWLDRSAQMNVETGKRYLNNARRFGFFNNADALPKLAWIEYLSGRPEDAIETLTVAAESQTGQAKALSLYYRGSILNRLGKPREARLSLDEALIERPDLLTAREEKGEALWRSGQKDEAVSVWTEAVRANAGLPLTLKFLSGASLEFGDAAASTDYEAQAERTIPNDPYFHWVVGLRLKGIGMNDLAEKQFSRAVKLDPAFQLRRFPRIGNGN